MWDIHAQARIYERDGQDALPVIPGEAGYFPNITAFLGWFENNDPFHYTSGISSSVFNGKGLRMLDEFYFVATSGTA